VKYFSRIARLQRATSKAQNTIGCPIQSERIAIHSSSGRNDKKFTVMKDE